VKLLFVFLPMLLLLPAVSSSVVVSFFFSLEIGWSISCCFTSASSSPRIFDFALKEASRLWLSKRWTFASAATSCIFGGIVGTWLFFRSHVYSKYALDADIFNRFHYTHSAASFLVFFDTELTPVLPWDHRRGLEIVSDGFPDALSAKASIVFVLMREIMQLTFCALNVFVRNQWEVTSSVCLSVEKIKVLQEDKNFLRSFGENFVVVVVSRTHAQCT